MPSSPRRRRRRSRWPSVADRRIADGSAGPLEGIPLAIKDLFCTDGVPTTRRQPHPRRLHPDLREHRHRPSVARRGRAAGQGEPGRVRHGLGQRHKPPWAGDQPVDAEGGRPQAGARRVVRRVGGGGRGADRRWALPRHRHRRVDPPAGGLLRHRRDEADLRALLALGHRRLRLVAGPGRADDPHGARCGDPCSPAWPASTRRTPPRSTWTCPTSRRRSPATSGV